MSKRQEIREKRRQQERMQRVGLIAGIVLVAVAIVGLVVWNQRPVEGVKDAPVLTRTPTNMNTAGDPNAPVKMIEYADFQCPYCMHFWRDTEAQIVQTYVNTGKLYVEYHSVGLFVGQESVRAAEAAYCAGDQNKFWDMHDIIFANQGAENSGALDDAHLRAFAQKISLDMTQFDSCFSSEKYASKVSQDAKDAQQNIPAASNFADLVAAQQYSASGISTPSFLINGKLIPGALGFADFQKEIDAALAAAGK